MNTIVDMFSKDSNPDEDLFILCSMMKEKGFYEILQYVHSKKNVQYNQVKKFAMENKIVDSNTFVIIILNGLINMGLLESTLDESMTQTYDVTSHGRKIIKYWNKKVFEKL